LNAGAATVTSLDAGAGLIKTTGGVQGSTFDGDDSGRRPVLAAVPTPRF